MKAQIIVGILGVVAVSGCAKHPSAMDVCKKLEGTGEAANCKSEQPAMMTARAKEKVVFDLPNVKVDGETKTGQVLTFASEADLDATSQAFEAMAALAGPHRYGSKKALVFVQANNGASPAVGQKLKGVVDAL